MTRVQVTVEVDTDDVRDVLEWMRGISIQNESNHRWLTAWVETEGEQRDAIAAHMPASLGWCVNEYDHRGSDALWAILGGYGTASQDAGVPDA